MKNEQYIMAIDEGTTSARVMLFDQQGAPVGKAQRKINQSYPHPGWVEQDPIEIWNTVETLVSEVLFQTETPPYKVRSIGITNQRETTIVWDRLTGKPIYPAIVWQSKQTAEIAKHWQQPEFANLIQQKTGLLVDAYFSATKIQWILQQVPGAQSRAEQGELLFGTIDTWLLWKLTNGQVHATDYTNASRTMLYNIQQKAWDPELLELFQIPAAMLPKVYPSGHLYGYTQDFTLMGVQIPIAALAGDQQASLFGQLALQPGMAKNTYGTGAFIMMNLGKQWRLSNHGLLTTLTCSLDDDEVGYAFEGSIFSAGSAIEWLHRQLKILTDPAKSAEIAAASHKSTDLYLVPAFNGLGAPYWDQRAQASFLGLTAHTNHSQMVAATIESLAFQTRAVLDTMAQETGLTLQSLVVDGGVSQNDYLLQFQADLLGKPIKRAPLSETTALGTAYLAGLTVGYWRDLAALRSQQPAGKVFTPQMTVADREHRYAGWQAAVTATQKFKDD
ncbi:glycerol kinase GlpK [Fructilactobacillus florum]|nr:glycerol kinase GlpK [Fructilactobacillus florum]